MATQSVTHKTCIDCQTAKPLTEFLLYKREQGCKVHEYRKGHCKACDKLRQRAWKDRTQPNRRQCNRRFTDPATGFVMKKCPACGEVKQVEMFKMNKGYPSVCHQCHCADTIRRRKDDPEPNRAIARRWRERNKEQAIQTCRNWYAANRESVCAGLRKGTPGYEKVLRNSRQWYRSLSFKDRQEISKRRKESKREWHQNNPERNRAARARRRARKADAPVIEVINRTAVIVRDRSTCYLWCNRVLTDNEITLDHVIPLSKGGSHSFNNLRVACRTCNSRKGTRLISELSDLSVRALVGGL